MKRWLAAAALAVVVGCSGSDGRAGAQGPQGPAGTSGSNGQPGAAGLNALISTSALAVGDAHCPTGGVEIDSGLDANANGVLDAEEINASATRFVCNGAQGVPGPVGPQGDAGPQGDVGPIGPAGDAGPQGVAGDPGFNALVATTRLTAGDATCPSGGVRIDVGLDVDRSGTLDTSEINPAETSYACNGVSPSTDPLTIVTDGGTGDSSWPGHTVVSIQTVNNEQLFQLNSGGNLFVSNPGLSSGGLYYQALTGALRVGESGTPTSAGGALPQDSVAMGANATASGDRSFTFNGTATAAGAVAIGSGAQATNDDALALGPSAIAGGVASVTIGPSNASGSFGVAIGLQNKASGNFSLALGKNADTNGFQGAVVISDASAQFSTDAMKATANNQVTIRGSGGIRLFTNMGGTTGCTMDPGGGTWNCTSDRDAKDHFAPVDGEAVLEKIARLPIESWEFKTDATRSRHVGPFAQDFHAAFGLGSSDKTISAVDADGINLLAIQALEKRTEEVKNLEAQVAELRARLDALTRRLDEKK